MFYYRKDIYIRIERGMVHVHPLDIEDKLFSFPQSLWEEQFDKGTVCYYSYLIYKKNNLNRVYDLTLFTKEV